MFKTILFPIDRSRESREAASLVVELVQQHKSRLVILSVVEEGAEDLAMTSVNAVDELLKGANELFSQQGITAETVERQGKPAFTICDVADEMGVDLIVMGSRGMGLTGEGSQDSVTNRVISLSPCPVLVVP
ncbi:universal stress protein [Alkalinema pantanalense CENA528]|uniref:universal stress protein n=1 Tax=Alkalinema pantanalense TaxID=1620705 RepID=UPI003D6EECC5